MAQAMTPQKYQACLDVCLRCVPSCESCSRMHDIPECAAICADCATVCAACIALMSRDSRFAPAICRACADICAACATECDKHPQCRECAEVCQRCAVECRKVAA
jgi:hypothetical protein